MGSQAALRPSSPPKKRARTSATHRGPSLDEERLKRLLGYNLSRADIRLRKAFNHHMAHLQLRPVEFSVLVLIASNPRINQKELGKVLDISPPNVAVLLDRLSERGLIERVRSSLDRRNQHLHLKPSGKVLVAQAEDVARTMEDAVLSVLSDGQRALLTELLQKLAQVPLDWAE
ncbi:MAG: MarR family transcriptional regulator [Burkholderiaceae bacterium]